MKLNTNSASNTEKLSFDIKESEVILIDDKQELRLSYGSWNGRPDKYDLRFWNSETNKCGKGFTLTAEQLIELRDFLNTNLET